MSEVHVENFSVEYAVARRSSMLCRINMSMLVDEEALASFTAAMERMRPGFGRDNGRAVSTVNALPSGAMVKAMT